MKTQKDSTAKKIIIGFAIAAAILISIPFCMGMYVGITSHTGTTGKVYKTLQENCACDKVEVDHSAYGLQFSRQDGLTGEKVAYILKNCNLSQPLTVEVDRLNNLLVENIEGYKDLDVVHLYFEIDDQKNQIIINNGIIQ